MEVVTTAVQYPGVINVPFENVPEPKYIKDSLVAINGTYAIEVEVKAGDGSVKKFWHYYPVKISQERKGNFYDMEVSPPILREGFACLHNGQILHVPAGDLMRRHVNVTRAITTPAKPESTDTGETPGNSVAPSPRRTNLESAAGFDLGSEVSEAIDLASKDQIESLQYLEDCEKGIW